MNNEEIAVFKINGDLKGLVSDVVITAPRRIFLKTDRKDLLEVIRYLAEKLEFTHLSTISGFDAGENFEALYHLANSSLNINVRTSAPRTEPGIPSICSVIPGAILYERELQDMFGIVVENIPDGRRLILPDSWPQGVYPLRKDWVFERPEEKIPGEKS